MTNKTGLRGTKPLGVKSLGVKSLGVKSLGVRPLSALALSLTLLCSLVRADARGPAGYDLSADLEASAETAATLDQVTLTLVASADDSGPASTADLTISIPEGAGFVSASADGASITDPGAGSSGDVTASFSAGVEAGSSVQLEVTVQINAEPGASLLFDGSVAGPEGDVDSGNNQASAVVVVEGATGSADLSVEVVPLADEAGSGALFSYEVDVENVSDDENAIAQGVTLAVPIPAGTTFASVSALADECSAPPVGAPHGTITCVYEELGPGDVVSLEVTVAVTARPGTSLDLLASAESATEDPDLDNNEAAESVDVLVSPPVVLDWDEPDDDSGEALPPPRDLVVLEGDDDSGARSSRPATPRETVVAYNVYGSPTPGVVPGPGALLATIPASATTATLPAAPAGTFYVVTAVYGSGESGPSNEASGLVPAATVASVKIKGTKLTAAGSAFTDQVQVLVDGVPFAAPAKVKKGGTKVVQKGGLVTGESLAAYLAAHPSVIVMFRNSNGGVAAYAYPH